MGPTLSISGPVATEQDYIRSTSDHWVDFEDNLRQFGNDVDFILIHLGNKDNASRIDDMVRRVKRKNPEALIIIVGRIPESLLESLADRKQIIFIYQEDFSCGNVIKMAEQKYTEWKEKQEEKRQQAQQKVKPKYPEKLRVLMLDDHIRLLSSFKTRFKASFSQDEYEIITAHEVSEVVEASRYDFILYDLLIPDLDQIQDLLIKSKATLISQTGASEDEITRHLSEELREHTALRFQRPYDIAGELFPIIKAARQQQIEAYEKALAAWETTQRKPEKPEKVKVLFVEDEKNWLREFRLLVREAFDQEEYESFFAETNEEALHILENNNINVAIVDLLVLDIHLGQKLNEIPHIVIISGYPEDGILDISSDLISKDVRERMGTLTKTDVNLPHQLLLKIKHARQQQIETYEKALAEWETTQTRAQQVPVRPERLTILWIEDEAQELDGVRERLSRTFGDGKEYEFVYATSMKEAVLKMQKQEFNTVVFDLLLTVDDKYLEKYINRLKSVANLYAVTLGGEHVSLMQLHSMFEEDFTKVKIIHKPQDIGTDRFKGSKFKRYAYIDQLIPKFKRIRGEQIEEYEHALTQWQAQQAKVAKQKQAVTGVQAETIFIINTSSAEANDLAEIVREKIGPEFNVVSMDSMFMLERELTKSTPTIVVTDMFIDNKDELDAVLQLVRERNPKAKFIVTSEEAAVISEARVKDKNVVALVEKPFYFQDVVKHIELSLSEQGRDVRLDKDVESGDISKGISDRERNTILSRARSVSGQDGIKRQVLLDLADDLGISLNTEQNLIGLAIDLQLEIPYSDRLTKEDKERLPKAIEHLLHCDIRNFPNEGRPRAIQAKDKYFLSHGGKYRGYRIIALIDEYFREGTALNDNLSEAILHDALEAVTPQGTHKDLYTGIQRRIRGEANPYGVAIRNYVNEQAATATVEQPWWQKAWNKTKGAFSRDVQLEKEQPSRLKDPAGIDFREIEIKKDE
jgi:CheY-like chemotaxis protein